MSTNKEFTSEEVKNIFSNTIKSFGGCGDISKKHSSVFDFTADDAVFHTYNNLSMEECLELQDKDYDTFYVMDEAPVAEFAAGCLEKLYSHVKTGKTDREMLHINEKLLCFARGADLVNAIICMGLQLSLYNRSKGDSEKAARPAATGELLDFYQNLLQIAGNYHQLDADTQTTLAQESDILDAETYETEKLGACCYHILDVLEKAKDFVPAEDDILFRPEMFHIATDILKLHYEQLCEEYDQVYDDLNRFVNDLFDGEIILDEDGSYNADLSVFRLAKQAAFGDADYPLYGDENRILE